MPIHSVTIGGAIISSNKMRHKENTTAGAVRLGSKHTLVEYIIY